MHLPPRDGWVLEEEQRYYIIDFPKNTTKKISKQNTLVSMNIKNIRISNELYNHFTEFCNKNQITIISALSCAIEEFLEKYKELDK